MKMVAEFGSNFYSIIISFIRNNDFQQNPMRASETRPSALIIILSSISFIFHSLIFFLNLVVHFLSFPLSSSFLFII